VSRLRLTAAGILPFVLTLPLLLRGGSNDGDIPVFRTYGDLMSSGRVPFRDFHPEYPPGAMPFFLLPALGSDEDYLGLFRILAAAGFLVGIVLLAFLVDRLEIEGWRRYAVLVYAGLVPALLGAFTLRRFDLWPEALCTGALLLLVERRAVFAFALLAVATVVKTYPVILLPIFLLYAERAVRLRALAVYCAIGLAVLVPFAAVGHAGLYNSYVGQWDRHLHLDSIGSSILLALERPIRISYDAGWSDFGAGADRVAQAHTAVQAVAVLAATYLFWRSRRTPRDLVAAAVVVLAAGAFLGKVLSPQFLLWVAPLILLASDWIAAAFLTAALLATNLLFPDRYAGLLARRGGEIALLCVRNALLVATVLALFVSFAQRVFREAAPSPPAGGSGGADRRREQDEVALGG
jgi:glycosyl transferase family 87